MKSCLLSQLPLSEKGKISRMPEDTSLREQFMRFGLIHGTEITAAYDSIGSTLRAYFFRGALIAIRNEDASRITVTTQSGGSP